MNCNPLKYFTIYIAIGLLFLWGCSSESTGWTSKAFHNTTAHYNGYYYARDEIRKIEAALQKSQKDDYNKVLRLFPMLDSVLAKSYENEIEEAIKMASIAIQRHPNSKWVDDSYLLVGKARLYSLDWGNAIQTFKFVNTKGKDINARHEAILLLARTFTEHGEFNNAEAAFNYLDKEKLNKKNRKNLYLEKAYHYQVRGDDDKLVGNLTLAVPLLEKEDKPARIYFIMGQVYQKLGFEAEAFNFFRECLQTHPVYEVDFYARLYMAQVAEISKSRNIANARKSFKKLLKDTKNKPFKDKIYYEMGVFERKQNNLNEALENFKLAIREGSNTQVDGEAYLRLGEIYYDTLKNYQTAKLYYDSAVAALNKDYENYEAIKTRQEILDEFVINLNTITWQDSLMVLAKLDSAALMQLVKTEVERNQKSQENTGKKKKRNRITINQVNTNTSSDGTFIVSDWYFGNPSARALGQQEFKRVWGSIPLEDNWRRSTRATPIANRPQIIEGTQDVNTSSGNENSTEPKGDPVLEEFNKINDQLPKTEKQVAEALTKIEDAYFALGDIYYFKLQESENAVKSFEELLSRFPLTFYRPEVLYKLYLIEKENNTTKVDSYRNELIENFPESTFAKILINPDYLVESSVTLEKQKMLYKEAYEKFENGDYNESRVVLDRAMALEKSSFYPNLELLKILISGKTENISLYIYQLDEFIKNNPDSPLKSYAEQLKMTARDFELRTEKDKGITYYQQFDKSHYFILLYRLDAKIENQVSGLLDTFNHSYFESDKLNVSNLTLNDSYSMTLITDLSDKDKALKYYYSFIEKLPSFNEIKNHKINTFVITKDNFDIFYRTKELDGYLQFFEKNYLQKNP